MLHRLRGKRWALVREQQHDAGQRQGDENAENGDKETREAAQRFLAPRGLRSAQSRRGANEQNPGHAAANRGLRQRHIDREQAYPDERQE